MLSRSPKVLLFARRGRKHRIDVPIRKRISRMKRDGLTATHRRYYYMVQLGIARIDDGNKLKD
jgi:hypothetical protein